MVCVLLTGCGWSFWGNRCCLGHRVIWSLDFRNVGNGKRDTQPMTSGGTYLVRLCHIYTFVAPCVGRGHNLRNNRRIDAPELGCEK